MAHARHRGCGIFRGEGNDDLAVLLFAVGFGGGDGAFEAEAAGLGGAALRQATIFSSDAPRRRLVVQSKWKGDGVFRAKVDGDTTTDASWPSAP